MDWAGQGGSTHWCGSELSSAELRHTCVFMRARWDMGWARLDNSTCQYIQHSGLLVCLVGVIGAHPGYAVASTGMCRNWICGGLGWAGLQHLSIDMNYGVGGGTDQAVAFTNMCIGWCR